MTKDEEKAGSRRRNHPKPGFHGRHCINFGLWSVDVGYGDRVSFDFGSHIEWIDRLIDRALRVERKKVTKEDPRSSKPTTGTSREQALLFLGLKAGASSSEIKKAVKRLQRLTHPDQNNGEAEAFELVDRIKDALGV